MDGGTRPDGGDSRPSGGAPAFAVRGPLLGRGAAAYARAEGLSLLHVKTLAPDVDDAGYASTRAFYRTMGFRPLETFTEIWGPDDPCLLLVRAL
jgi:hypothetical protein